MYMGIFLKGCVLLGEEMFPLACCMISVTSLGEPERLSRMAESAEEDVDGTPESLFLNTFVVSLKYFYEQPTRVQIEMFRRSHCVASVVLYSYAKYKSRIWPIGQIQ